MYTRAFMQEIDLPHLSYLPKNKITETFSD